MTDNILLDIDSHGVASVTIDRQGHTMNTLSPELGADLAAVLDQLEADRSIQAVVITSGKPESFVAGADVYWLASLDDPNEALELLREVHRHFLRLQYLSVYRRKPVVAAIHGACLGGGLELALACWSRLASDAPSTQLGQPEIQLGLIPGAGGTQRLPRRVGLERGIDMILSGRPLRAREALKAGLVDQLVSPEDLYESAYRRAIGGIGRLDTETTRSRSRVDVASLRRAALERIAPARRLVFTQAEKRMLAETRGNYPAPAAALRAIRAGYEEGIQAGYHTEIEEFAKLLGSKANRALMSIFFATQELKSDSGVEEEEAPRTIDRVGIVGGGLMGGGIAAVNAINAKVPSVIKEVDDHGVARGIAYVEKVIERRLDRGRMTPEAASEARALASGGTDWSGFGEVDLVIEAVFEDLDLKRRVLSEVENVTGQETIFATNTSSIPIAAIADGSTRPAQVIGMHYFSPVERMQLLEIVVHQGTAGWVTATCVAFGKRQGKTVIVVNDGPGFYTTRILAPYMNEVGYLLGEGVPIDAIDDAMISWGFPVGPVTNIDEVGIDVGAKIAKIMTDAFGDRLRPPDVFQKLVEDDRRGRKNGRGFYRYVDGKRKGIDESVYEVLGVDPGSTPPTTLIQERLALQFVNEAARCLDEGILRTPRDGDVGALFGFGFPAFRGGPFTWVDQVGASVVVDRLRAFADEHGPRYDPADNLVDHARSGARFRPQPGSSP